MQVPKEFEDFILKHYGLACSDFLVTLYKRIGFVVTATVYAGTLDDNPLCEVNRLLKKHVK